ncbi:MAG TPA: vWA domain-containing protein, partial [Thermoanaerobaculia bacterium]|nr:vWA domain-containing protein [Thermoanaerobaculia bacterium]
ADTGAVHRFSIVEFADDAKVPLAGQVIRIDKADPAAIDRVRALLETAVSAKDWGNTNTAAAIEAALGELQTMRRSDPPGPRRRVVLLITDGRPTVPGVDNAELRSRIRTHAARLAAEGAELWVIGLNDADNYWTAGDGGFWEEVAGKKRARLAENASAAMPSIFQDVVDEWLDVRSTIVRGDQYDCPPYLRRIVFNVTFGRPRGDVKILDPDGNPVPRSAGGPAVTPGTFALFTVDDPKPGTYTIERDPSRAETVHVEELPAAVERLEPRGESDAGVETPLVFLARKASGDPVQPLIEYPLDASVTVTDALGNRADLPAKARPDGRFAAAWKPAKPGRYNAVLHGYVRRKDGTQYDVFANAGGSYSPIVDVGNRQPYSLRLVVPDPVKGLRTVPWRRVAALRFELLEPDGDVVKPAGLVAQPESWLTVQSLDARGGALGPPVPLHPDASGQFAAEVPLKVAWTRGEGTWSKPGTLSFRVAAVPGRFVGPRYLRSIALPPGLEDRRIGSDPLSAGPLDVRLALWLWALVVLLAAVCVALLGWLSFGRWLPASLIGRHDHAAGRTISLKVYDELRDPTGSSAIDFGLNGRRVADLPVNLDVDGSSVNADRFRFVRELNDRRPRGTLRYRWRGSKKTFSTRLSAGDAKSLDGLPGGNYVALLVEQSQQ